MIRFAAKKKRTTALRVQPKKSSWYVRVDLSSMVGRMSALGANRASAAITEKR
jgi:hypothetical protein